jgi:hypothetical protein
VVVEPAAKLLHSKPVHRLRGGGLRRIWDDHALCRNLVARGDAIIDPLVDFFLDPADSALPKRNALRKGPAAHIFIDGAVPLADFGLHFAQANDSF